jgi:DNA-binding transcriptional LysR family regulator
MADQFPGATKMVLSPAAQAVLRADAAARCLSEWDSVNDPPCHPSDGDWNGCIRCVNRSAVAASLLAAADQVVPEELWLGTEEPCYAYYRQRRKTRRDLRALANELENHQ